LWVALRALEDRAALHERLARQAEAGGRELSAERFREDSHDMATSIAVLRRLVRADEAEDD
jgi:hypothetical protein